MGVAQAIYQQKLREPRLDFEAEIHVSVSDPYADIRQVITDLRADATRSRANSWAYKTQSALNAHNWWLSGIDEGASVEARDAAGWSDIRADQLERALKSLVRHMEAQDETR